MTSNSPSESKEPFHASFYYDPALFGLEPDEFALRASVKKIPGTPEVLNPAFLSLANAFPGYTAEQCVFEKMSIAVFIKEGMPSVAAIHNMDPEAIKKGNTVQFQEGGMGVFMSPEIVDKLLGIIQVGKNRGELLEMMAEEKDDF